MEKRRSLKRGVEVKEDKKIRGIPRGGNMERIEINILVGCLM